MCADSSLAALQPDSPMLLASEHSAHSVNEGEAHDNANDIDDEEDDVSIMSMTDDEEEEADPPVRCEEPVMLGHAYQMLVPSN